MKSTRRNKLYYYSGSTMIRVPTTVYGSGEDLEITSLWHRRLRPIVEVVSGYRHDPGKGHWQAVKWILRYLLKTVDVGLVFREIIHVISMLALFIQIVLVTWINVGRQLVMCLLFQEHQ